LKITLTNFFWSSRFATLTGHLKLHQQSLYFRKHCTRSGDHGYATATQLNTTLVPKPVLIPELSKRGSRRVLKKVTNAGNDEELRRGDSKWRNGRVLKRLREVEEGGEGVRKEGTEGETKGMTVSKEHSYGTQRDSSPDHDQVGIITILIITKENFSIFMLKLDESFSDKTFFYNLFFLTVQFFFFSLLLIFCPLDLDLGIHIFLWI